MQTWKCVVCEKDFKAGDWICADGVANHVVPEKTYRCLDAPSDPSTKDAELKNGRTIVCNIPPPKKIMRGDEVQYVGEGSVEFIRGRYATSDPEKQYYLDKKPSYNASEEEWKAVWYSPAQLLEIGKMELSAARQRLENDRNELLSQVQQQKKSKVA